MPARRPSARRYSLSVVLAVLAATTAALSAQSPQAARSSWMTHHFQDVLTLHDAVVRGDLRAAQTLGQHIAVEPDPPRLSDAGRARVGRIRAMASDVANAQTIETAAAATAGMVATCGDCHDARSTRVPLPPAAPTAAVGGIVGHMIVHREALEDLLAGLVMPSAAEWHEGARRLEGAALPAHSLPSDPKLTASVKAADSRVHQLAGDALAATTPDARVAVYSKLLTTCASCHSLHPSVWGPTAH